MRERERETERDRDRDRQTDRQTDTETETETETETYKLIHFQKLPGEFLIMLSLRAHFIDVKSNSPLKRLRSIPLMF